MGKAWRDIYGVSPGLDREVVVHLAGAGASAVCCARNLEGLEETVSRVAKVGGEATVASGDVTMETSVRALTLWSTILDVSTSSSTAPE